MLRRIKKEGWIIVKTVGKFNLSKPSLEVAFQKSIEYSECLDSGMLSFSRKERFFFI
jgi:hypothetical protein